MRTEPSGAPFRLTWVPGRGRLRCSSAGPTWACGSGCCSWPKSVGFNAFQLPTFSGGVRTDCVVGIERDSLSGIKSLTGEVPHGRDDRPLVGARARRMRVRGPAFGPALAQTHRAYGGRDRG